MIISQTPFRISFVGGGTDLPSFYRLFRGRVLNTTIDKYVYVIIKERFDDLIVLNYYKKEIVDNINKIQHDYIREALKLTEIKRGIEITILSDIPSNGSGLGSSSSLTVGLLNAFYAFKGDQKNLDSLAKEDLRIKDKEKLEIDILKCPIGKQDQYAAVFGGMKLYTFNTNDTVAIESIEISQNEISKLYSNLHLVFTGIMRKSSTILSEQNKNTEANIEHLKEMSNMPIDLKKIIEKKEYRKLGKYLDTAWKYKKHLANGITNMEINELYEQGIKNGALGGKLLGAGGGGFILFYVPPEKKDFFISNIKKSYKILPFDFERYGTKIIFNSK